MWRDPISKYKTNCHILKHAQDRSAILTESLMAGNGASPGSSLNRGSRAPPQTCTCSVLRWTRTRSIDSVPTASVHCCHSWQSSERLLHWCSRFSQAYAPLNGGRIEGLPTFQTVQSWHLRKLTLSRSGRGIHGTCCLSVGHHGKRGSILPETEWGCLQPTASKAV